ncbi:hypothetical protein CON36_28260 [Bacillus cereus]|uniref:Uncharacterized protein n=2 Tax=Bacillus cereus group TaxID=86661 RepID=A0A9X6ZPV9_BACTU|nr:MULTISPECIES: hypothetical protein [Bacillus cereus group]PDZ95448.1 hypothetical protein CON36_28260 [Bacillus cereus]PFJ27159.1 hypothetical protein COJ15_34580 [Bacillus thuringiensis]
MKKRIAKKKQKAFFEPFLHALQTSLGKNPSTSYGLPNFCYNTIQDLTVIFKRNSDSEISVWIDFDELYDKMGKCYVKNKVISIQNTDVLILLLQELSISNYHFGKSLIYETYGEVPEETYSNEWYEERAATFQKNKKEAYALHLRMRNEFINQVNAIPIVDRINYNYDSKWNDFNDFEVLLLADINDDEVQQVRQRLVDIEGEINARHEGEIGYAKKLYFEQPVFYI